MEVEYRKVVCEGGNRGACPKKEENRSPSNPEGPRECKVTLKIDKSASFCMGSLGGRVVGEEKGQHSRPNAEVYWGFTLHKITTQEKRKFNRILAKKKRGKPHFPERELRSHELGHRNLPELRAQSHKGKKENKILSS